MVSRVTTAEAGSRRMPDGRSDQSRGAWLWRWCRMGGWISLASITSPRSPAKIRDNHRFYTQDARHAAGQALGEPGRRERLSPVLRRREGQPRHRPDVLRLAGARASAAARAASSAPALRVNGDARADVVAAAISTSMGVTHGEIVERDGRLTLDFEDPEGQRLALVDDGGAGDPPTPWDRSPVPAEHQIRGLGPIVISVPTLDPTDTLLTRVLNMRQVRDYPHPDNPGDARARVRDGRRRRPHAELHVAVQPDLPAARQGAGGVHHVAFRTPDADYDAWADRLNELGIPNSGKVDRFWFRSLYFREPNGVLFEIATDGPGLRGGRRPGDAGREGGAAAVPRAAARRRSSPTSSRSTDPTPDPESHVHDPRSPCRPARARQRRRPRRRAARRDPASRPRRLRRRHPRPASESQCDGCRLSRAAGGRPHLVSRIRSLRRWSRTSPASARRSAWSPDSCRAPRRAWHVRPSASC